MVTTSVATAARVAAARPEGDPVFPEWPARRLLTGAAGGVRSSPMVGYRAETARASGCLARMACRTGLVARRSRASEPAARPLSALLALIYSECHAHLRIPLQEGPHLRGDAAHDRRSDHRMHRLRRDRATGLPPRGGALQGLGLLQHRLRQEEGAGGRSSDSSKESSSSTTSSNSDSKSRLEEVGLQVGPSSSSSPRRPRSPAPTEPYFRRAAKNFLVGASAAPTTPTCETSG